jgi:single-strand DNA-binding protein
MNVLNAIGNINKPEIRYLADQTPILQFSFALNSGYGEKQITTWLNCSLFGKRATKLSEMLSTGDRVGITGEIVNRKYQDKAGQDKYSLECRVSDITLLGQREGGLSREDKVKEQIDNLTDSQRALLKEKIGFDDFEDDIPF